MFVLGEGDDVVSHATPGPRPEVRHMPGAGVLWISFDAASASDAIARCEQTIAAYLPEAPRLPIIMEPAVAVTEPCRACE